MQLVTFGRWVFLEKNFGIVIGAPDERGSLFLFRGALLANCEKLLDVDGCHQIFEIVAKHLGAEAIDVISNIERASAYFNHPLIRDYWHGDGSALDRFDDIAVSIEQVEAVIREQEIAEAGRLAKRKHTRRRRSQFAAVRSDLVLALLDAGHPYVCSHPLCGISTNLTLDHKKALSRGGTDALDNLQFMCVSHNSQKRDGP